ncbi:hypothetical protein [Salegentibacter mishustinae]|uniref:hypothetical protein n=1 Tax=Salegentibacter mishustinae TaxID=270918 RepID=UPI0024917C85|nr:hypothetical protein [Salegentibacter mishustinae]
MLYTSGTNLESSAIKFIETNEKVTIFSAYMKLHELQKINKSKNISRIIVRWDLIDLCLGVSDLEVYNYCIENNIALYRNTRLHMKVIWNNQQSMIFGSANVTGRGLGENKRYNFELNGEVKDISFETIKYLNEVIKNSQYITPSFYNLIESKVRQNSEQINLPELELESIEEYHSQFLLSSLPMTMAVDKLYEKSLNSDRLNAIEQNCLAHDLALYNLNPKDDKSVFYNKLKYEFNKHPFIVALKSYIVQVGSLHYGGVVNWIKDNTTNVPIPRNWEIKKQEIVNILYEWICYLDSNFTWSRPSYSQVIHYENYNYVEKLEKILNNLNRDRARGIKAPHQIILLISISEYFKQENKQTISLDKLNQLFTYKWIENEQAFQSDNKDIVMPFKALHNLNLIQTKIEPQLLNSIRSFNDLSQKISEIRLEDGLAEILKNLYRPHDIIKNHL